MNIFQAFEQGEGRATFEGYEKYAIRDLTRFIWQSENNLTGDFVSEGELRCNDWIPYVPSEERKIEGLVKYTDPWDVYYRVVNGWRKMGYRDDYIEKFVIKPNVPRETCSSYGQALPPLKTKHKEVFEEVLWIRDAKTNAVYPYIIKSPFDKFVWKKTKMTLEWEE